MENQSKAMAILARVIPVLFFLPLVAGKKSDYDVFHANQCLLMFLLAVAIRVIGCIPILGWLIGIVAGVIWLVLWVMGIVWACQDRMDPLPIIGKIEILK